MFPITESKVLLEFLGKPLIEHRIEQALSAGLRDVVIVANQQNCNTLRNMASRFADADISTTVQGDGGGIAGALNSARHLLDEEFIVVSPGDVFEASAYSQIMTARTRVSATSYLLGVATERYFPGGYLVVNGERAIKRIIEKPGKGAEPSDTVTIMAHLHTDAGALFHSLDGIIDKDLDVYERALQLMIDQGYELRMVDYRGFWGPMKYPWHVLEVMGFFLEQASSIVAPSAEISDRAVLDGKVLIGENVRVLENAVVRGPCYIGDNTIIGNSALIRGGCHIGTNCVIGFSTEVKHSYIGDGCSFHHNYIGDSVIADRCSFGAGTVTSNLRLDGEEIVVRGRGGSEATGLGKLGAMVGSGTSVGVNVSIMPGVRIGPGCVVGPHVMVTRDMEPATVLMLDSDNRPMRRLRHHKDGGG